MFCAVLVTSPLAAHGTFHAQYLRLQEEIAANPQDALLQCRLANLFAEHEDFATALGALERATELDPKLATIELVRGEVLCAAGRSAEARESLNRFLAREQSNSLGWLLRARVRTSLGEARAALEDFRSALRTNRSPEPDLYQEVGDALAAQGELDEALAILADGLRTLGPIPSLSLRAIELESVAGRCDAALARVDQLQRTAARPEPWMVRRAELLAHAGRSVEAVAAWRELRAHLAALPAEIRSTHAMSRLAERAQQELAASENRAALRQSASLSSHQPLVPSSE